MSLSGVLSATQGGARGIAAWIDRQDDRPLVRGAALVLGVLVFLFLVRAFPYLDARGYWRAARYTSLYAGGLTGYLYSPAFLQLLTPITALPWQVFYGIWLALLVALLLFTAGPTIGILLLLTVVIPARFEVFPLDVVRHYLASGNIFLIMAFAAAASFRWPWASAFNLLTKVSPGVTLVWFVARREWRQLGVAIVATALVSAVSFALAPSAWLEWIHLLLSNVGAPEPAFAYHVLPFWARLALAAGLTVVAARYDQRWVVPIAAMIALPYISLTSLVMPVAAVPLLLRRRWTLPPDERAGEPARTVGLAASGAPIAQA